MKRKIFSLVFLLFVLSSLSCNHKDRNDEQVVATINGLKLTLNEFQSRLAEELELENDFKLTREARREFLESIIKKELLIQKAKELNLDKEEAFIRAIERFWEATLIKDLIDLKGKEITKKIVVSQEEVKARYDLMVEEDKDLPPLGEVEKTIARELKEIKKTKRLGEWINSLRKEASVNINTQLLYRD